MKFFFDNNLSPYHAKAIAILSSTEGHDVLHLRDKFDQAVPDIVWLEGLAAEGGWIIISGDFRISRNPLERRAWKEAQLLTFFLAKAWRHQKFWDQAWRLVRWWPFIVQQATLVRPGAAFEISVNPTGRFKQLP